MLFSSLPFLYWFLPVTLLAYFIVPAKLKNAVLLLSSMVFYAWGEKLLVVLFACSITVGWGIGRGMEKCTDLRKRRFLLGLAVLIDLGLLGYFKYADFFLGTIHSLSGADLPLVHAVLPIGISFYTFQLLSYDIDVYRRTVPAQKNLITFAAYVSMFPQLIAGPIVRYADVKEDLENRTHSVDAASEGIRRFMLGLAEKILLANAFGQLCTQFRTAATCSVLFYWLYAAGYMLQIYYDFSGYSNMAIGLGRIFGFRFMENFNYPYISSSITEFWRRWHISLGSWFRDYVYIPLGGNRRGIARQLVNILTVWMLTGLWHGAAWNFVLWGLLYAVLLIIEKLGWKKFLDRHKGIGHVYVLLTVMAGFVLFNADSLTQAWADLSGLVSFGRLPLCTVESIYYLRSYGMTFVIGILGCTPLLKTLTEHLRKSPAGERLVNVLEMVIPAVLLLVISGYLADGSFNPFLYFRF